MNEVFITSFKQKDAITFLTLTHDSYPVIICYYVLQKKHIYYQIWRCQVGESKEGTKENESTYGFGHLRTNKKINQKITH